MLQWQIQQIEKQNFKWKVEFWKTLYLHRELDNFPRIKNSSDTSGDINNVILWNKELGQHLKELHNSVNLYFPSDQCMMLQNSFKQQVTEHEESWSGFRLTFKRHNLSSSGVVAKKNIYNNLNRSLKRSILYHLSLWGRIFFINLHQNSLLQQIEYLIKYENSALFYLDRCYRFIKCKIMSLFSLLFIVL